MPLYAYNKTGSPLALAAGGVTLPASASPPARGPAINVTAELKSLSGANYTSLQAQVTAGSVDFEWSLSAEYSTTNLTIPDSLNAPSGSVSASALAVADANGLAAGANIRVAFTAGGGGSADDVVIYSANAPFKFRVLDTKIIISTVVALATVQLRDATGGGGSALSDSLAAAAVGVKRDVLMTSTGTVSSGGTLVLRRSDNGVAGEVIVFIRKET